MKLGVLARLRREVGLAKNNKALAAMVEDFGKVTNRSSGRNVTKVCPYFIVMSHKLKKISRMVLVSSTAWPSD